MDWRQLWAKSDPYHPLWCHLLDVAAVCEALVPRFGGVSPLPVSWLLWVAALHDLGKADRYFQNKDEALAVSLRDQGFDIPTDAQPFRHEERSADWLFTHLRDDRGWGTRAARVIRQAVSGHHGNFAPTPLPDTGPRQEEWQAVRRAMAAMVADVLALEPFVLEQFPDASVAGLRLSGLIVLSDWIASNHELYAYPSLARSLSPHEYFAAARREAQRAVASLGLAPLGVNPAEEPFPFSHVWPECTRLRPSQRALEAEARAGRLTPGLLILEAPMGEGKTEGAVYVAEEWRRQEQALGGAYLALPTAATSNQIHARYSTFLQQRWPEMPAPRLVHGMAWLVDAVTPSTPAQTYDEAGARGWTSERSLSLDWFRNTKRALLAPEGVGTIDQALMAVLNVKHGFLRLLGLSRKVLIVDEVHAYDEYMTVLLERLLHWCRCLGVPVILLSATLSAGQRQRLAQAYGAELPVEPLAAYPLLTHVPLHGSPRTVPVPADPERDRRILVKRHPGLLLDAVGTAHLALKAVEDGGCACVLANTVGQAQAIFRALQDLVRQEPQLADTDLFLFHARFTAGDRQDREDQVVGLFGKDAGKDGRPPRPARAVLVATQVVEQSLDVDFDVFISQIAPVDLLLQRCGRLHRHERGVRPTGLEAVLHVLLPEDSTLEFGPTAYVYQAQEPLLRTHALLAGLSEFRLPQDFRPLISACYDGAPVPAGVVSEPDLQEAAEIRRELGRKAAAEACTHLVAAPRAKTFVLAEMVEAVWEGEEGGPTGYFHAQTRLGDPTLQLLLLEDPAHLALLESETAPKRSDLRGLLRRQVKVPAWWLRDLTAEVPFPPLEASPAWLRHHQSVRMHGREWRGRDAQGRSVILRDDPELGVVRLVEKKETYDDAHV